MTAPRRICVVTTSRADYGLLQSPMRAIMASPHFDLQLVVAGMHLAPEFGLTVTEIEKDGFPIDARVEMLVSSDTGVGIAKSIGLGVSGFADAFERLAPDLVLLLGDRFEMLAAGCAALVARLPIAHLCGGDVTEGAYDEAIRHSLSKMAHLHFPTNEEARGRLMQMGEDPAQIHAVGSTGLDLIRDLPLPARDVLAGELGIAADRPWLLVTFHPVTLDTRPSIDQLDALLTALSRPALTRFDIIITQPNADNEGRALAARIADWCAGQPNARLFASLGQRRYLAALREASAVIGNSSSGLYEAPSFQRPTVNIGSRQRGRLRATSVIDCAPETDAIEQAITAALAMDCRDVTNPYGAGDSAKRIVAILESTPDFMALLAKRFQDRSA